MWEMLLSLCDSADSSGFVKTWCALNEGTRGSIIDGVIVVLLVGGGVLLWRIIWRLVIPQLLPAPATEATFHSHFEPDEAKQWHEEGSALRKQLGDQPGAAPNLYQLARLAQDHGMSAEAKQLYEESLAVKKRLGDRAGAARVLHQLATLAEERGEIEEARRLYEESLAVEQQLGDQMGMALTLGQLGLLAEQRGDKAEAVRHLYQSLEICERLQSPYAEIAREALARVKGKGV